MTKPQIKEYNCETGEEIIRDATDAEITQIKIRTELELQEKAEDEAKKAQRQAILSRLGITEEEARILLG